MDYDKIHKRLKKASNIFIMGHKNLDLDAIGGCLALADYCKQIKKQAYVIVDDTKHEFSITQALTYIKDNTKIKIDRFKELEKYVDDKSLLVIVDVFNIKRGQSPNAANVIQNMIIIDHHLFGKPLTDDFFIDSSISSTCELLCGLFRKKQKIVDKYVATVMLGGIEIDTNAYTLKVTANTFDSSSYLLNCGGNMSIATSFSKTRMKDYVRVQRAIFKTDFYLKKYAIVACDNEETYDIWELAIMADTLLEFKEVEASFVIGRISKDTIAISARSNKYNVEKIMKKYKGGGHKTTAAAQVKEGNIKKIKREIKAVLQ